MQPGEGAEAYGSSAVNGWEERKLVYTGLLVACGVIALAAGFAAGIWSFLQVAVMIEVACWIGTPRGYLKRRW